MSRTGAIVTIAITALIGLALRLIVINGQALKPGARLPPTC
ncbi:MAG: hypothetical protein U0703_13410 [Anaerolineae bacterium]